MVLLIIRTFVIKKYCDVIIVEKIPTLGYVQVTIVNEDNLKEVLENIQNDERYKNEGCSCCESDFEELINDLNNFSWTLERY